MIENEKEKSVEVSFYTLRIALKAYFTTYKAIKTNLIYSGEGEVGENQEYIELYISTIIHFQHFLELFLKSILREIHELMVVEGVTEPYVLYCLIKNKEVTSGKSIRTVTFSRTIEIFYELQEKGVIHSKYNFLKEHKHSIKELNRFRNEIIHRGLHRLSYKELDKFVVKRILPIVKGVLELEVGRKFTKLWGGKVLESNLDIVDELCDLGKGNQVSYKKIALLKELGRSSYNNPLYTKDDGFGDIYEIENEVMMEKYEAIAGIEKQLEQVDYIGKCPCCGLITLVHYFEAKFEYNEFEGNYYRSGYSNNFEEASCTCCGFTINKYINRKTWKEYIEVDKK